MCDSCFDPSPFEKKPLTVDEVGATNGGGQVIEEPENAEWDRDPTNRQQFEKYTQAFVDWVFDEYGFNVLTQDMIELKITGRLTRCLGKATVNGIRDVDVKISWEAYDSRNYDWDRLRETVKHELAHASNYCELAHMGHGPAFRNEARRLGLDDDHLSRYFNKKDPQYFVVCSVCGHCSWRTKKSKFVKDPNSTYSCSGCGALDWEVKQESPVNWHPKWS
jgi:predicted SprT family Zn-dependent metalloprotease